jgi:hypothetical protein
MPEVNAQATGTGRHCACCGHAVGDEGATIERFGQRFCSEAHAEQFAAGVRAVRIQAAAQTQASPAACSMPPAGQRNRKDYLKRGACWGAPLLVLLALPLFWTGNPIAAAGGSILSVLALLACPLGMFFMMRAMGSMGRGQQPSQKDDANVPAEPGADATKEPRWRRS